ncbi:MAG: NAD(P)/FAD-dependent oxidoreductase [Phycisphaerales bacterium]|nr:NAD(P)/FAD-dependent oxidoreductase [Phycisphaerales bacterium]MCB9854816.1 NAD(P)/FAD-dependent oxidoreductase [Phycisphaerales bacterium]MCB9863712.1 NAD(P)/FAD-dependent oxidoreductase [Phycisphaerales bacterium]
MAISGDHSESLDVAIIGGGAAGLATAIFAKRRMPDRSIAILDGATKLGAKILVSGGGRCNVTNRVVTTKDFWGGSSNIIKRVLAALSVERTIAFFAELGVALHEEPNGKLFPDSNKANTVVDALLREARRLNVRMLTAHRVNAIRREHDAFAIDVHVSPSATEHEPGETTLRARCVVLATGGKSLPKTGSDGAGYAMAAALGHSIVPLTPALAPLVLDGKLHGQLSGISQNVELTTRSDGEKPVILRGEMLWTHFGVSGPVVLNASRHWHRATLEGRDVTIVLSFLPGEDFAAVESRLVAMMTAHPKVHLHNALATLLPARVAEALLASIGVAGSVPMGQLPKEARRKVAHALTALPLRVRDSRGYAYAEVTAGGVPLTEIDGRTMASRKCPGLFLVGEILDVDGRIGGFNFQWAWSGAFVAAGGIEAALDA